MSTLASDSALPELSPPSLSAAVPPEDDIRSQVWGILTSLYPRGRIIERRREMRYPFPHLIVLTPVNDTGERQVDETVVVAGRQLSERGLGFFHPTPLPFRHVIATLELDGGREVSFLLDLNWCRFTRRGWYESGGRFLKVCAPPAVEPQKLAV